MAYVPGFLVQVFPNVSKLGKCSRRVLKHVVDSEKVSVCKLVRRNVGSVQNKLTALL